MFYLNLFFKRCFDIISSLIAILLLFPVWIITPIAIKIDTKGPILFVQERRTIKGKIFKMYKFRTMVVNAERDAIGIFNYENDIRVTKVGKMLRTTSIDELPQLFNILFGQMSLVGPRPCVKYELGDFDTLNKKYKKRFEMKSGLTGWAQVMGRNNISWDEKVTFDNEYIELFKKYGILFDIKIIFTSFLKIFKKENIYESAVEGISAEESAKIQEEEIIRIAHLPD